MDDHAETRARRGRGPFEHLEITVGVAERNEWTVTDCLLDADRLAGLVVDEVDLSEPEQRWAATSGVVAVLHATADDLLGGDSVYALRPRPDELDAAARH